MASIVTTRITLPVVATREECKDIAAQLYGADSNAFACVDSQANHDAFVSRCLSIAISAMAFGDTSRLKRMEAYAVTLPSYKLGKDNVITGRLGKLICAYRDAATLGASLRPKLDPASNDVDLSLLDCSPVMGALIAAPVKKEATAVKTPKTPTVPAEETKTPEQLQAIEAEKAQAMRDSLARIAEIEAAKNAEIADLAAKNAALEIAASLPAIKTVEQHAESLQAALLFFGMSLIEADQKRLEALQVEIITKRLEAEASALIANTKALNSADNIALTA